MNECNLLYPWWPENDSRYNTGVNTPPASLRVTMYVTLWVIIFFVYFHFLRMADNLDNPLVTTGLEQLPLSILPKDTYAHNAYQLQNLSLNTSYEEENVHVSECDAKFYADHLENRGEVYPIEACIPKAYVLILNNHEGIKEGQERPGSEKDVALMEKLWKGFQCNVKVERNQTAKEMDQTLKDFSNNTIHESCDFCVVIIMSHASFRNPSIVTGTDGKYIETNTVLELFRDRPHLNGKPKLIFFQSCRGEHKAEKLNPKKSYTKIIPSSSDILVVYSTTEDDMSFREEATGSWFINAIARVFSNKARTEHVADMLTEVGNKVSQINPDGDRQMSEFASTLRKKLYLFPGFPKTQK